MIEYEVINNSQLHENYYFLFMDLSNSSQKYSFWVISANLEPVNSPISEMFKIIVVENAMKWILIFYNF